MLAQITECDRELLDSIEKEQKEIKYKVPTTRTKTTRDFFSIWRRVSYDWNKLLHLYYIILIYICKYLLINLLE